MSALLARQDKIDIAIDLTDTQKIVDQRFSPIAQPQFRLITSDILVLWGPILWTILSLTQYSFQAGYEQYYNERILRLPNTFMPTDNTRPISTRPMSRRKWGFLTTVLYFAVLTIIIKFHPKNLISGCGSFLRLRAACFGCAIRMHGLQTICAPTV